jgi:hypothetical protein
LHDFYKKVGAPDIEDWQSTTKQKLTKYKSVGEAKKSN